MNRTYSVVHNGALTAAADLFEISPADDRPVEIVALYIAQTSDAGDAQDEMIGVDIIRGHATSGSGGAVATPTPLGSSLGAAAGFTAETGNTTVASAGTPTTLHSDAFNVRAGFTFIPLAEARPGANQGNGTLVVRLSAPADSLSYKATLVLRELG